MKNDVMQKIALVINALNNVTVCGEQNLVNLSGSIAVLKEIVSQLNTCEIAERKETERIKK